MLAMYLSANSNRASSSSNGWKGSIGKSHIGASENREIYWVRTFEWIEGKKEKRKLNVC